MKYLLFIIIAFLLWVTAPMWKPDRSGMKLIPDSQESVVEDIAVNGKEQNDPTATSYTKKFGKAPQLDLTTHIPTDVQRYWKHRFKNADSYKGMHCTKPTQSPKGWKTTCTISVTDDSELHLDEETYYIKWGRVTQ